MIVLVCGGRRFTDRAFVFRTLDRVHSKRPITLVIEGGQRHRDVRGKLVGGADWLASEWANIIAIKLLTVEADWGDITVPGAVIKKDALGRKYNANAGPQRNAKMLTYGPDVVVAFEGGTGTADMTSKAAKANVATVFPRKGADDWLSRDEP